MFRALCVVASTSLLAAAGVAAQSTLPAPATAAPATAAPKGLLEGAYTAAQADKGAATYKMTCAACHGPMLEGAEFVPELVGEAFLDRWVDTSVRELVIKIVGTMPPDRSVVLTDAQAAEVIARILQANGYPVGPEPLPSQAAVLTPIKIVKPKKP